MKLGKLLTACAGLVLMASSAVAGPVWACGPEDQGLLKLECFG